MSGSLCTCKSHVCFRLSPSWNLCPSSVSTFRVQVLPTVQATSRCHQTHPGLEAAANPHRALEKVGDSRSQRARLMVSIVLSGLVDVWSVTSVTWLLCGRYVVGKMSEVVSKTRRFIQSASLTFRLSRAVCWTVMTHVLLCIIRNRGILDSRTSTGSQYFGIAINALRCLTRNYGREKRLFSVRVVPWDSI